MKQTPKPKVKFSRAPKAFYDCIRKVGKGRQNIKVSPTAFMLIKAFHKIHPDYVAIAGFTRISKPLNGSLEINYEMGKRHERRKFKIFC